MIKNVLVVGHADADGHVIAEQTRSNLSVVSSWNVDVVVDPLRTQGHRSWLAVEKLHEIAHADLVVFVDLMFSPINYAAESDALVAFVKRMPTKRFLLIDHHPLPERRLSKADNLRFIYRPDVGDCTLGPRSGLMILAALCENQVEAVADVVQEHHLELAKSMRRAAAPGGELPGKLLMALLSGRRWDLISAVGSEPASLHRLVRGRRVAESVTSPALEAAVQGAKLLLKRNVKQYESPINGGEGRDSMPFDVEGERYEAREPSDPAVYQNSPKRTRDVEMIATLIEVAALSLTEAPGATFTKAELLGEIRAIAGEGTEITERDIDNVIGKASFLQQSSGGRLRLG